MRHKVLILGSLGEFTELVQMAGKKGYETVVCDGYPDGPARKYADRSYVIPVTEIDRIATLCREENCGQGRTALLSETRAAALVQG